MKLPKFIPKALALAFLSLAVLLAGIGSCQRRIHGRPLPQSLPHPTMALLDERARPFIDEAREAVPGAVSELCARRGHLYWLMLKDRANGSTLARDFISGVLEPRVIAPLGKAAAIYGCAANPDSVSSLMTEAGADTLARQLYASAGLAIEAVFIKATIQSLLNVLQSCAPKLAASWGLCGTLAAADGPFPVGDAIGAALAVGGTVWSCSDLVKAYKALPGELEQALQTSIEATVAQCRQEAASAL